MVVEAGTIALHSGSHAGWIEIDCDGVVAKVDLVVQIKEPVIPNPPRSSQWIGQRLAWGPIVGTITIVLGLVGLLAIPNLSISLPTSLPALPSPVSIDTPPGKIAILWNRTA